MAEKIMVVLGLLSLGYFAGIVAYAGWSSKFPVFWAVLGFCFLAAAWAIHKSMQFPLGIKILGFAGIGSGLALFLVVEVLIVGAMLQKPEPGLDYVVVLGAQVKGSSPSQSLLYRIQEAAEYLKLPDSGSSRIPEGKSRDKSHSFRGKRHRRGHIRSPLYETGIGKNGNFNGTTYRRKPFHQYQREYCVLL